MSKKQQFKEFRKSHRDESFTATTWRYGWQIILAVVMCPILSACCGELSGGELFSPPTGQAELVLVEYSVSNSDYGSGIEQFVYKNEQHYLWDIHHYNSTIGELGIWQRFDKVDLWISTGVEVADDIQTIKSYFWYGDCKAVSEGVRNGMVIAVTISIEWIEIEVSGAFDCRKTGTIVPVYYEYKSRIQASQSNIEAYLHGVGR